MTLESFARTVSKSHCGSALGIKLQPWQLRMMRDLDDYYARAASAGVSLDDATALLASRMKRAQGSLRYTSADALIT